MTDTAEKDLQSRGSSSLWRPLRVPTFRNLLVADVVSDIGTFMQNVGAAWLMVSLGAGRIYVALTQTAASLPYFLLALPAGSAGDIFDRRKLVLATESWMMGIALLLAVLTIGGFVLPWLLLVLTFALSAGDAFETPTWRAILPELVAKDDLAAASALNGIEFNLARAVGPALAGVVIAVAGVATAFVANFVRRSGPTSRHPSRSCVCRGWNNRECDVRALRKTSRFDQGSESMEPLAHAGCRQRGCN